jgi:PAS domain S-box-containing protein
LLLVLLALTSLLALALVALLLGARRTATANHALRLSEQRYRDIVETQADLICRYLPDTTLTFVNGAYCRYFGRTREELIGTKFTDLIPEGDRAKSLAHLRSLIEHPRTEAFTHEVLQKEGQIGWQQWVDHVITDSQGRVVEIQAIGRDVTQLKLAEAKAAERREQLTHLTRVSMLGQLSNALAEDLIQPLTAILCNARATQLLVKQEPIDIGEVQRTLGDIVTDNSRVNAVIERLRAVLKRNTLSYDHIDVAQLITEALDLTRSQLSERSITVETQLALDLPRIPGDRMRLQQVLLNLLDNAMDAMGDPVARDRTLTVSATLDRRLVLISVVDNGDGIAPIAWSRLFEPFVTTKHQGLGLGLAISRSIVEAHGGHLVARNNAAGRGATFTVSLPCGDGTKG